MMFDQKTQNQFTVSFTVPSSRLQTVLGVIDGEIHNLKIEQVLPSMQLTLEPLPAPPPRVIGRRAKPRRPGNGICPLILRDMVAGEIYEFNDLAAKVSSAGWALNSASPAISLLTKMGFLDKQGVSMWSRTAKVFDPYEVLKEGE